MFVETGLWLRAQWFPRPGENDWLDPVTPRSARPRNGVGICDVSTLGKIDVRAPTRRNSSTASTPTAFVAARRPGALRPMLREDGFVMDDGTAARLAEHHFFVTTTTANAVNVYQHMHFCHQVLWPELDVQFVSVTDQWAQFAVAGPNSRELLREIVDARSTSPMPPFPTWRPAMSRSAGASGAPFRISFSGELAYEIGVPARHGDALLRKLMEAGQDLGVVPTASRR